MAEYCGEQIEVLHDWVQWREPSMVPNLYNFLSGLMLSNEISYIHQKFFQMLKML